MTGLRSYDVVIAGREVVGASIASADLVHAHEVATGIHLIEKEMTPRIERPRHARVGIRGLALDGESAGAAR